MLLELHERQSVAIQSPAREILYGGAAGGGKSHLLRIAAISWCYDIPGLQVYLFRRLSDDLFKNHMVGPSGFPALLAEWVDSGFARINYSRNYIEIGSHGSRIHLCHCQYEQDVYKYQGAEIHVALFDELTHFTQFQYSYLRSRVRLGGLEVPEKYRGRFARIIAATNPGGIGHNWVKDAWVDHDPTGSMRIWRAPRDEGGMLRQYIPARLDDNPTMEAQRAEYEHQLEGLGDPALVRAMLDGDWNIVSGGMFDDIWNASVVLPDGSRCRGHQVLICEPFPIPPQWYLDRSHDYGDDAPFWTGWWAESNGETVTIEGSERSWPKGHLFLIGEDYGWNKRPNKGIHLTAPEIARRGVQVELELGIRGRVRAGPGDIPDLLNGTSPRDQYARVGLAFTKPDKGPGSRIAGWQRLRQLMRASLTVPQEEPGITFFSTCHQAIRTVPALPRNVRKRDDVDTDSEDHPGDGIRYRVVAKHHELGFLKSAV